MEVWGAALYGDPCTECAWAWPRDPATNIAFVRSLPELYGEILVDATGDERHLALSWSVTGYVCHVADNLRLWAERVSEAMASGDARIAGYDPDVVASAEGYEEIALPLALGTLEQSVQTWLSVLVDAVAVEVVLLHESRGQQTAADIASNNAHDAHHHAWDITRSIRATEPTAGQT